MSVQLMVSERYKHRARSAFASTMIGLSIAGVILILLEAVLWVVPLPIIQRVETIGGFVPEPWGYRAARNARMISKTATHKISAVFDDEALAYRSPPSENGERVLFIGDSFTQGTQEAMYPRDFRQILEKKMGGLVSPEVINGGVQGYNGAEVYNWFMDYGAEYEADLVVYGFFFNDVTGYFDNQALRVGKSRPGFLIADKTLSDVSVYGQLVIPHPFDLGLFLKWNSRLYKFIHRSVSPPSPYGLAVRDGWVIELIPTISPTEMRALEAIKDHVREIKRRQERHGGRIAILLIPDGSEVSIDRGEPRYFTEMKRMCAEIGIYCVDPTTNLRLARADGEKVYWNTLDDGDAHCTPAGYRVIAETLAQAYLSSNAFTSSVQRDKFAVRQSEAISSSWKPETKKYEFPEVSSDGGLRVLVANPPGGVSIKLPVKAGEVAELGLTLELSGPLTVRFADGNDRVYLSGSDGILRYLVRPKHDFPELLLYADNQTQFTVQGVRLTFDSRDPVEILEGAF